VCPKSHAHPAEAVLQVARKRGRFVGDGLTRTSGWMSPRVEPVMSASWIMRLPPAIHLPAAWRRVKGSQCFRGCDERMGSDMGTSIITIHFRTYPKVDPGRRSIGSDDRTERDDMLQPMMTFYRGRDDSNAERAHSFCSLRFIPLRPK
jgi:hypothetical protein